MNLYTMDTGFFKLDGGAMFGVVPKSIWNKLNPADENNMCSWALRCLLVEDDNRLVLIDTGMGNKQDAKFFGHYYLHGSASLDASLKAHGFSRDDITDVFLTHLHFDHCGGAIEKKGDEFVSAFRNADFWSNTLHWEWATHPNDREKASFLKENILPIKETGRLKWINAVNEGEQYPLRKVTDPSLPFDLRIVNGHTKAMMLPQLQYKGRTIVYMADLLPSQAHIPLPYVMAYDMYPLSTLAEKKSFLEEAVTNEYVLYFEHDPQYECCTLQRTEKGIRAGEFFPLSAL